MTIPERLAQLREKPEAVRRRIAFGAALAIALFLGILWLAALSAGRLSPPTATTTPSFVVRQFDRVGRGVSILVDSVRAFF